MRNPIGFIFLILGLVLLVYGVIATDSLSSSFSKFFTGSPTDKSIWMMIGGAVLTAIGLSLTISGKNKSG